MFVTEAEYERWPSDMWDQLAREGDGRRTCANCAHDGQCADLHYCGGSCWEAQEPNEELEEGEVIYAVKDETKEAGDGE